MRLWRADARADGGRIGRAPRAVVVLAVAAAGLPVLLHGSDLAATEPADAAPAVFTPLEPCRLADTVQTGGRLDAGTAVDVAVTGSCGVPEDATSVAVTVTAIGPSDRGYLTVSPAGVERPLVSSLNYVAGATISNQQLVRLGDGGELSVYSRAATDVTVDVRGYFAAADGAASQGRFVPLTPRRLVDTREFGRPDPLEPVRVEANVPEDAIAVAVSVASTDTLGPGSFTIAAVGAVRRDSPVLTIDRAGQTRSASTIAAVSGAAFDVFSSAGDHIIVDVTGYFTGPSAEASTDGLFVAAAPTRILDTRLPYGPNGGPRIWDHGARAVDVSTFTGGSAAALALNLTVTETEDRGYAVASSANTNMPRISSINYDTAKMTIASSSIVRVSTAGVAVLVREAAHVVLDVTGWFTGQPEVSTGPVPQNNPPPDRSVTIIGDSAMAGLRWNGAYGGLRGFTANPRLESCRRLVAPSCNGREGYNPRTAASQITALPPAGPEDILVIATGYNDWHARFSSDFDEIYRRARLKGFRHIAWVDYRVDVGYRLPGTSARSNYEQMNVELQAKVASGLYPEVVIWSRSTYTAGMGAWFTSDGVHQRGIGSWGMADWISRHVRAFDERPCAMPAVPGGPIQDPCPNPDLTPAVAGAPDIVALYGLG